MALEPTTTDNETDLDNGLAGTVDRILDKGLVINADVTIDVAGTELLGIKIRAALASFETAAEYGLEFPAGTEETKAYAEAQAQTETCPQCGKRGEKEILLEDECPWCGWKSARSKRLDDGESVPISSSTDEQDDHREEPPALSDDDATALTTNMDE